MTEILESQIDTLRLFKMMCKIKTIKDHYIGFTTWHLEFKLRHMRSDYTNANSPSYNSKLNNFIRDNGGWENWQMQLISEGDWQNRKHAQQQQQALVKASPWATLNQEYYTKTKEEQLEERRETDRIYKYKNRFKEADKKNQKCVCDVCGSVFSHGNKSKHIQTMKHQIGLKTQQTETNSEN